MSIAHQVEPPAAEQVALWIVNGVPARIVHDGVRYRVTDSPTRLEDELAALTHPLPITGWRFQGTDAHGNSRMFDVRRGRDEWILVRT